MKESGKGNEKISRDEVDDVIKNYIIEVLRSNKVLRYTGIIEKIEEIEDKNKDEKTKIRNIRYRVKKILKKHSVDYANRKSFDKEHFIYKIKKKDLNKYPEIEGLISQSDLKKAENATFYFLPESLYEPVTVKYYVKELLELIKDINSYYNTLKEKKIENLLNEEKIKIKIEQFKGLVFDLWNPDYAKYLSIDMIKKIFKKMMLGTSQLVNGSNFENYKKIEEENVKVREHLYQIDEGNTLNKLTNIIYMALPSALESKELTKSDIQMKYYLFALMKYANKKITDFFFNQFDTILKTEECKDKNSEEEKINCFLSYLNRNMSYGFTKEIFENALKSYIVLINAEKNNEKLKKEINAEKNRENLNIDINAETNKKNLDIDIQEFYNFILGLFENEKWAKYEKGFLQKLICSEENKGILSEILIMKREDILKKYKDYLPTNKNIADLFYCLLHFVTIIENRKGTIFV